MKDFSEKCRQIFFYGGIQQQEYEEIAGEVAESNRSSLSIASLCLLLMFGGLFAGSLFSEMMAPNRMAYASVGAMFLVIHLLCRMMRKKGKKFIIPLWYVALTAMCTYAIILNTFIRNDISATTFCVIMIVAPLLFTDRIWRMLLYIILVVVFFVLLDFRQKAYYLAYTDTVNVICCVFIGSVTHFFIIRTKLTEMTQRRHIERERDTDKLTGCMTKAAFERILQKKMKDGEKKGTLLVMDLDHFKNVNDTYGHVFGDFVLRAMGECLLGSLPENAMCGRFGGDEFQVWIPGITDRKNLTGMLGELMQRVETIETPDDRVKLGVSIGVAVCPYNGNQYPELFKNADASLYLAKKQGRKRYVFYSGD